MHLVGVFLLYRTQRYRNFVPHRFFPYRGSLLHVRYYLSGRLDSDKIVDSVVTWKDSVFDMYNQLCDHCLELNRTSMIALVMKLVSLSKVDTNDKFCAKAVILMRELREKFVQRNLLFPEILYIAVFPMIMEKESVVRDKMFQVCQGRFRRTIQRMPKTQQKLKKGIESMSTQ